MKTIRRTAIIASVLVGSGSVIAGLATAASVPEHKGFGHYGKIKALKLDTNKDGAVTREELLSHNTERFKRLDFNEDGSISKDEFNARLITMFKKMDTNGDGKLNGDEMPKRHGAGHSRNDHGRRHG